MNKMQETLLNFISCFVFAVMLAAVFIVPFTVVMGCIKLIMIMFGG